MLPCTRFGIETSHLQLFLELEAFKASRTIPGVLWYFTMWVTKAAIRLFVDVHVCIWYLQYIGLIIPEW